MPSDEQPDSPTSAANEVSSDTKRKFREALERKHANGGLHKGEVSGHGKVGGAHNAETSGAQQMFRRKSGSA